MMPTEPELCDRRTEKSPNEETPEKAIAETIETVVRPYIERHGGAIRFCSFIDGIVYVELSGACHSCPALKFTLTLHVERILRKTFRAVRAVRQWND